MSMAIDGAKRLKVHLRKWENEVFSRSIADHEHFFSDPVLSWQSQILHQTSISSTRMYATPYHDILRVQQFSNLGVHS